VPDALIIVKALAADYRRFAQDAEQKGDTVRVNSHIKRADAVEAVAHELESARKRLRPVPTSFGDLSDLPEEVIAQLSLNKVDELEQQMRDIVAAGDGYEVGLDTIIIELYRRHKIIQERRFVMNKLYRMAQKGTITSVEGKKGVYVVPKPVANDGGWATPKKGGFEDDLDADIPF
jgi:hypothetical protein